MQELYVGCEVMLNNFYFVLIDADEYALRYMENHSGQFPHANIHLILSKLRGPAASHVSEIKRVFTEIDPSSTGQLTYENFRYTHMCTCLLLYSEYYFCYVKTNISQETEFHLLNLHSLYD